MGFVERRSGSSAGRALLGGLLTMLAGCHLVFTYEEAPPPGRDARAKDAPGDRPVTSVEIERPRDSRWTSETAPPVLDLASQTPVPDAAPVADVGAQVGCGAPAPWAACLEDAARGWCRADTGAVSVECLARGPSLWTCVCDGSPPFDHPGGAATNSPCGDVCCQALLNCPI